MRQGDEFQIFFCFLKKLYVRQKQVVSTLVFNIILVDLDLDIQKYKLYNNGDG